jgi:hypothetical protein
MKLTGTAWYTYMREQRDAATKALDTETDPKRQRSLRARRDRYVGFLTMGPDGTSDATRKRNETVGAGR